MKPGIAGGGEPDAGFRGLDERGETSLGLLAGGVADDHLAQVEVPGNGQLAFAWLKRGVGFANDQMMTGEEQGAPEVFPLDARVAVGDAEHEARYFGFNRAECVQAADAVVDEFGFALFGLDVDAAF